MPTPPSPSSRPMAPPSRFAVTASAVTASAVIASAVTARRLSLWLLLLLLGVLWQPWAQAQQIAVGGDESIIVDNGVTYRVHVFESDGTLTLNTPIDLEYLIVGGGGSGGSAGPYGGGGGGGAGGMLTGTLTNQTADSYSITVGQGGADIVDNHTPGNEGGDSSAFGLTAVGGGRGGSGNQGGATDGGSGGGEGTVSIGVQSPGVGQGVSGQGNEGGQADPPSGGGGGGAGAVGGSPPNTATAANGGDGLDSSITGASVFYAGGGAGSGPTLTGSGATALAVPIGDGGTGGGGGSGAIDGVDGTGGGGAGGLHTDQRSGAGGSGIVIVRYALFSPDKSQLSAAPNAVIADGTSTATVTLQLLDQNNNQITTGGENVIFSTTAGTLSSVTDNGDGTYSATLTSSTPATATLTASVSGVSITDDAQVVFEPPATTGTPEAGTQGSGCDVFLVEDAGEVFRVHRCEGDETLSINNTLLDAEYLIVAGGGGGGTRRGGGGGGGGLRSGSLSLPIGDYSIEVGAGGSGGTDNAVPTNGEDSSAFGITATGGGAGASGNGGVETQSAQSGGSGGGGNFFFQNYDGGAGSASQGNAGGNFTDGAGGGGGGGAGESGFDATNQGGDESYGGVGLESSITGQPLFYAGGGGGARQFAPSLGGDGGGGDGGNADDGPLFGRTGTAGLGGGGGGGYGGGDGGNGGAGIVILRYATVADVLKSTITPAPQAITADGSATSTITVQLKDAYGEDYPVSGGTLSLETNHGTLSAVTDNNDGTYTATLTSSQTVTTATISATLDVNGLVKPFGDTARVDFVAEPLQGQVLLDNGVGGGTAHNGQQDGDEIGIPDITVRLLEDSDDDGQCPANAPVLHTTTTQGDGGWQIAPTPAQAGTAVCLVVDTPTGRRPVSESGGTGSVTLGARDDARLAFTLPPTDTAWEGINVGMIETPTLAAGQQAVVTPGRFAVFRHRLVATSDATLDIALNATTTPTTPPWEQAVYRNQACDGDLTSADRALPLTNIAVAADQPICLVVQTFAPAEAAPGAQQRLALTATQTLTLADGSTASDQVSLVNTATVQGDALVLTKEVRNIGLDGVQGNNDDGDSAYTDRNQAKPCEVLRYRITYTNTGTTALADVSLKDATPAFTFLADELSCPTQLPDSLTACTPSTPNGTNAEFHEGAVQWQFTGQLTPGAQGNVTYDVRLQGPRPGYNVQCEE